MATALLYVCVLVFFVLGYIAGRLDLIAGRLTGPTGPVYQSPLSKKAGRQDDPVAAAAKISINDAKFVTPITTAGMQKAGQTELGKTTTAADDINSAASKLAQLKGR